MRFSAFILYLFPTLALSGFTPRISRHGNVPISRRTNTTCPPLFTLTAYSTDPNQPQPISGGTVFESERLMYLHTSVNVPLTYPEANVTFFRNDTTHLYATGFKTVYEDEAPVPPFQVLTYENDGSVEFVNEPAVYEQYNDYVDGTYTEKNGTLEFHSNDKNNLTTPDPNPSATGWFVCGTGYYLSVHMATTGWSAADTACWNVTMVIDYQDVVYNDLDVCYFNG